MTSCAVTESKHDSLPMKASQGRQPLLPNIYHSVAN